MFGQFTRLVSDASGWAYGIVFLFAFLDALVPVVPSEASVITAGVVAAAGGLYLPLIVAAAAGGAFLGDNAAYLIGRRFGIRAKKRFFHGDKARKTIDWAERQLAVRGGELIAVARFIPGGRTAVTLSAGAALYPSRAALPCSMPLRRSSGPCTHRCSDTSAGGRSRMHLGRGFCLRSGSPSRWQAAWRLCAGISGAGQAAAPSRTCDPARHACQPRSRHPAPGNLRRSETGQRRRPHA